MAFKLLKYTLNLRLLIGEIQNFRIYGKLYYMQRYINIELYNNNIPHYIRSYLYNPAFIVEQSITRYLQLNLDLFCQFTKILH